MTIYIRRNSSKLKAFLTKTAALDSLKKEMDLYEIVEAFNFALGGVKNRMVLENMINYIGSEYCDTIIDEYLEHRFDIEFDEYKIADIEDIDKWLEKL